jgi:hypothetical protein
MRLAAKISKTPLTPLADLSRPQTGKKEKRKKKKNQSRKKKNQEVAASSEQ